MKDQKKFRRRNINNNVELPFNLPPLLRKIYASRGICSAADLERSIKGILPWQQLSNIEKAANMLYDAFCSGVHIIVVGDFDADGATGTALSVLCLRALGCSSVEYLVPNRFEDGYGLSPKIVELAHAHGAKIIMTVDNGISSHEGIDRAHQLGISVLITDHHLPKKIIPNAEVVVNPNLHYCNFPSKFLSGVGVAFYVMLALRTLLYERNWFTSHSITIPNLAEYLDLVALGTVADVVPLDVNNRILIWQGIIRIRAGKCRPGIKALLEVANCKAERLTSSDLSFCVVPRLNAAGRIGDMSVGISLLLSNDVSEARTLANQLDMLNQTRKEIEHSMQTKALSLCKRLQNSSNKEIPNSFAIYHPKWHQGVIGILASRIKERFHRPTIAFASAGKGILKGSGRSIQGLHIRNILEYIDNLHPGLIIEFGGHEIAVGLSLEESKLDEFRQYFVEAVTECFDPSLLQKEMISDGPLLPEEMSMEVANMLRDAGPWGQMFPEPLFDGHFLLLHQKIVKQHHLKVIIEPVESVGPLLNGIAFNVDTAVWPNNSICKVELLYKLDIKEVYGNRRLQIIINNIWPL